MPTKVYLEIANKKVFACAVDWPGWARSGKTEEDALAALAEYAPRYAVIAERAGLRFPKSAGDAFDVRERVAGNGTTEFGAPAISPELDAGEIKKAEATRLAKLLRAAWDEFDAVSAKSPAELRKGPRGGGRDRDKMVGHVRDSEVGYARVIGVKERPDGDLREDILAVLGRPGDGTAPGRKGWPIRYAARRFTWHVLDHLWEMQDRSS